MTQPTPMHGVDETEDSKHLRSVVGAEIQAVMDKHEVGGVVMLCSRESAAWITVFAKWSGLQEDAVHGMRVRFNSKLPDAQARVDSTMGLIANLRDMCSDYANVFRSVYQQVVDSLEKQGAVVEHKPLSARRRRPDPMGKVYQHFAGFREGPQTAARTHDGARPTAYRDPARLLLGFDAGTQRLLDDLNAKPPSFDRDEIIRRAKKLRYHSFKSEDATPTVTLIKHLAAAGFKDLAKLAGEDRYEQGPAESRRWAESPEGREALSQLQSDPALRQKMAGVIERLDEAGKSLDVEAVLAELIRQGIAEKTTKD
jgi:hypothetical protein